MYPIKFGLWSIGVASWIFGISDRALATFTDGRVSAQELSLLFVASFYAGCWLFLVPEGGDRP